MTSFLTLEGRRALVTCGTLGVQDLGATVPTTAHLDPAQPQLA